MFCIAAIDMASRDHLVEQHAIRMCDCALLLLTRQIGNISFGSIVRECEIVHCCDRYFKQKASCQDVSIAVMDDASRHFLIGTINHALI